MLCKMGQFKKCLFELILGHGGSYRAHMHVRFLVVGHQCKVAGDPKSTRFGMTSCVITVISPSDNAGHDIVASYAVPNATTLRLRNRSQNGADHERFQPRWSCYDSSFNCNGAVNVLIKMISDLGCIRRPFMSSLSIYHFFCDPQVPYHDTPIRSRNRMVGNLVMGHPRWCSLETMLIY